MSPSVARTPGPGKPAAGQRAGLHAGRFRKAPARHSRGHGHTTPASARAAGWSGDAASPLAWPPRPALPAPLSSSRPVAPSPSGTCCHLATPRGAAPRAQSAAAVRGLRAVLAIAAPPPLPRGGRRAVESILQVTPHPVARVDRIDARAATAVAPLMAGVGPPARAAAQLARLSCTEGLGPRIRTCATGAPNVLARLALQSTPCGPFLIARLDELRSYPSRWAPGRPRPRLLYGGSGASESSCGRARPLRLLSATTVFAPP